RDVSNDAVDQHFEIENGIDLLRRLLKLEQVLNQLLLPNGGQGEGRSRCCGDGRHRNSRNSELDVSSMRSHPSLLMLLDALGCILLLTGLSVATFLRDSRTVTRVFVSQCIFFYFGEGGTARPYSEDLPTRSKYW